ncbi:MAG: extracellular matrix regulator RemB [Acutalibacteraceae bacterium]
MYLHLGQSTVITTDEIVGIFDLDNTTVSKKTRDFLFQAQKEKRVVYVSSELPKSFIVCLDNTVYISQISCATLIKRIHTQKKDQFAFDGEF